MLMKLLCLLIVVIFIIDIIMWGVSYCIGDYYISDIKDIDKLIDRLSIDIDRSGKFELVYLPVRLKTISSRVYLSLIGGIHIGYGFARMSYISYLYTHYVWVEQIVKYRKPIADTKKSKKDIKNLFY